MSIKIKKNSAKVHFAEEVNGVVGIHAEGNRLSLHQIAGIVKVGSEITTEDMTFNPRVDLNFYKVESIDALIECLLVVRQNLLPPKPSNLFTINDSTLPEAC
jgi:hypothetical protein